MVLKRLLSCFSLLTLCLPALPLFAQGDRGTAELKAGPGKIVIEYGRPQLKGRDPVTMQKDGGYWRMGSDATTTITTAVDLRAGTTQIPKGKYSLWLHKVSAGNYRLVFNSALPDMGMLHDVSKDVASVPMKLVKTSTPVETLLMSLKEAPGGGIFQMSWGTLSLSTNLDFAR